MAIIILSAGILFFINPEKAIFFPRCPFHMLTGLYCPGCGSARALHHLLHADFARAFRYNPLIILLLPFLIYSYISYAASSMNEKYKFNLLIRPILILELMVAMVLFTILRNLQWLPFFNLAH